jgi:hypothetical protein
MSLAKITFHSDKTTSKSGEKNGKPWTITEQDATIETPFMRMPCKISLNRDQAPYKAGTYEFDVARALKVSDFGSIQLGRDLHLNPAKPA